MVIISQVFGFNDNVGLSTSSGIVLVLLLFVFWSASSDERDSTRASDGYCGHRLVYILISPSYPAIFPLWRATEGRGHASLCAEWRVQGLLKSRARFTKNDAHLHSIEKVENEQKQMLILTLVSGYFDLVKAYFILLWHLLVILLVIIRMRLSHK